MDNISNVEVSYLLTDWCKEANVSTKDVNYKINDKDGIIYIFTAYCGCMIGKAGDIINRHTNKLEETLKKYKIKKKYKYELVETTPSDFWVNYDFYGE